MSIISQFKERDHSLKSKDDANKMGIYQVFFKDNVELQEERMVNNLFCKLSDLR